MADSTRLLRHQFPYRPTDGTIAPMFLVRAVALLGLLAIPAFLVGEALDLYGLRLVAKPWPVLGLAVAVWHLGRRPIARPVAFGLVLSAIGDLLLEISPATFLPGVGAFLLAHLAYIAAFVGERRGPHPWRTIPFIFWGVGVLAWLRPGLDAAGMFVPVAIYTTVICAMLWRAASWLGDGMRNSQYAFVGALLFASSDTLIAVERFAPDLIFDGVAYPIITLYWLGQAMIARSTGPDAVD